MFIIQLNIRTTLVRVSSGVGPSGLETESTDGVLLFNECNISSSQAIWVGKIALTAIYRSPSCFAKQFNTDYLPPFPKFWPGYRKLKNGYFFCPVTQINKTTSATCQDNSYFFVKQTLSMSHHHNPNILHTDFNDTLTYSLFPEVNSDNKRFIDFEEKE